MPEMNHGDADPYVPEPPHYARYRKAWGLPDPALIPADETPIIEPMGQLADLLQEGQNISVPQTAETTKPEPESPDAESIRSLAYSYWEAREYLNISGSAEGDWLTAEKTLTV